MALAVIKALKVNPLRSCHCCLNAGWEKGPDKMMIMLTTMMVMVMLFVKDLPSQLMHVGRTINSCELHFLQLSFQK